jgi:hypothetical protein
MRDIRRITGPAVAVTLLAACGSSSVSEAPSGTLEADVAIPSSITVASLPSELVSLWLGEKTFLTFNDGRLSYDETHGWPVMDATGARFSLGTDGGSDVCPAGDEGTYRWRVSEGGGWLALEIIDDMCPARAEMLPGVFERSACPSFPDNFCLGDLEAGRHNSAFFRPLDPATEWVRQHGAMAYTVPEGWSNVADHPDEYTLQPTGEDGETGIYLWSEVAIVSTDAPCSPDPDPEIARTPAAMMNWLTSNPLLQVTEPLEVAIDGLPGLTATASVKPDVSLPCIGAGAVAPMLVNADGRGLQWGFTASLVQEMYFLDLGDERTLVISIDGVDRDAFESIRDDAIAIVESIEFRR